MSNKYAFVDKEGTYFVTSTVVGWADVFTRDIYRNILLDSFRFCQEKQGLHIHAWVLMLNHFHMIYSCDEGKDPGMIMKNIKSFTAIKLLDAIINSPQESRKEWLLNLFEDYGTKNKSNARYQFWQHENHPILLNTIEKTKQRMNYLHENPVRAGFVSQPEYWLYSSAMDYYATKGKGLLELAIL